MINQVLKAVTGLDIRNDSFQHQLFETLMTTYVEELLASINKREPNLIKSKVRVERQMMCVGFI